MKNVIYYENNVIEVVLENEYIKVHLVNVGASIFKLFYNDVDIVVGPKDLNDFIKKGHYYGKTVGRFSGRLPIKFSVKELKNINLKPYKGEASTIHGGENGFSSKYFNYHPTKENEVVFSSLQKETDDNLPGDVYLEVKYELVDDTLNVTYYATTTETTLLNITNHVYFNLDASHTITDHELNINADKFVLFDEAYNIKGLKEVDGTLYNFKSYKSLKKPLSELSETPFKGLDTIFMLNEEKFLNLYSPKNNTNLKISTNYPAVVVYTHNDISPDGLDYFKLWPYAGIALECEYEPGGSLTDFLSDSILKKGQEYQHFITYTLTKK